MLVFSAIFLTTGSLWANAKAKTRRKRATVKVEIKR